MKPLHVLMALLLCSCAPKRAVLDPPIQTIERKTWIALETVPDKFTILVLDAQAEAEAVRELCQKHKYVCLGSQQAGRVIVVERRRK